VKKLALILTTFLSLSNAYAQSATESLGFEDATFPELAVSSRALAMGNAFIGKVDDSSAAFYNPAGLGTVRNTHFRLSNFHLEVNKGWMDVGTGGNITDTPGNFMDAFSLDGTRKLLEGEKDDILSHSRFQLIPNFTTRYFSLGYLITRQMRARMFNPEDTGVREYQYAYRRDHGPYAAANVSLFGGILKLGITGTMLFRKEIVASHNPSSEIDLGDDDYKKGSAFILTGGVRITLPYTYLPTLAATLHNIGDQEFKGRALGAPDAIKRNLVVGASITPQLSNRIRLHLEVNYRDLTDEYEDVADKRKFSAGMELDFARSVFVRAGLGDGWGSYGLGFRTRRIEFDLTSYAIDRTRSTIRGKEDRRFVLGLSTGI
jgi:hypothetical protein